MMLWFGKMEDGRSVKKYNLIEKTNFTVGRMFDNDLVIDNIYISRYHANIYQIKNNVVITDKHSKNGVYVNNKLINKKKILKSNDVISFFEQEYKILIFDARIRKKLIKYLDAVDEKYDLRV